MAKRSAKGNSEIAAQAERMEADLSIIRRLLRRPLESAFERGNLTTPQTAAMRVIFRQQGISLKDLSREISLSHSTVSGIVDRLEKRGLVERRTDSSDGRVSRIYPTAVVNHFVRDEMPALMRGPLQKALAAAESEERGRLEMAIHRIRELLERA
jgi:DNA-binding MarR family transcriptional regulator